MMFRIAVNDHHLGVVYRQSTPSFSVQQFLLQPSDIQKMTLQQFYQSGAPVPGLIVWTTLAPYQEKHQANLIDINLGRVRYQKTENLKTNVYDYRHWLTSTVFDSSFLNRIMRYPAEVLTPPFFYPDLIEFFTTMSVRDLPQFGRHQKLHDLSIYKHPIKIRFLDQREARENDETLHYLYWDSQVLFFESTRPGFYLLNGQTIYRNGEVELIEYQFKHGQAVTYRRDTLRKELEQETAVRVKANTPVKQPNYTNLKTNQGSLDHDSGLGTLTSTGSLSNAAAPLLPYFYLHSSGFEKLIMGF